jgi:hypothetical protein
VSSSGVSHQSIAGAKGDFGDLAQGRHAKDAKHPITPLHPGVGEDSLKIIWRIMKREAAITACVFVPALKTLSSIPEE